MGWRNLLTCIRPAVEMYNTDDTVMEDGESGKSKIIKRSTKTQTSETPRFIRRITACFSGKFPGMNEGWDIVRIPIYLWTKILGGLCGIVI